MINIIYLLILMLWGLLLLNLIQPFTKPPFP
ncbi:MAG: DUF1145 domain-containing protein [Sodalis sp. (in: enterobacteria)]